jgi:TolB-like protein
MNSPNMEAETVSRAQVLGQLERILSSAPFAASERSWVLLKFLVEQALNNGAGRLKEYTIGMEALGKAPSFDPRTDPIVRAEASRLRARLEKYYAGDGLSDPIVIMLPKGSYVPRFQTRPEPAATTSVRWRPRLLSERFAWFGMGMAVALCAIVIAAWSYWHAPQQDMPVSVAVLPFANMSGDPSQEFFSDGMAEEINSALASVPNLRVVARTSAFQFKNQNRDVHAIAQALHASHLVEGSVRKSGTRVRITAELVRAEDGVNIWTNSYERDMADVFAIQEEIAGAVSTALRAPLGLKQGEHLVSSRPKDQETYELYLRGRAALRGRTRQEVDLLGQVVARDQNFAPGWAKLSEARREMAIDLERRGDAARRPQLLDGAEAAARKAIALDPRYAGGYAALSGVDFVRGKWAEAIDLAKQGLALDPEEPELLNNYSTTLRALGYLKEGLRIREQLALLEPFDALYNRQTAELRLANGKIDEGIKSLEVLHGAAIAGYSLAAAYSEQGRFNEAADVLLEAPVYQAFRPVHDSAIEAFRALAQRRAPATSLPVFDEEFSFVYIALGEPERLLDWPEKAMSNSDYRPITSLWWPMPASVRRTERFKMLVRNAGLVDYWRAHGWPDLCHPVGADDFACN